MSSANAAENELRAELDHHEHARAQMAVMRDLTEGIHKLYAGDFDESTRNLGLGDVRSDHLFGWAMANYTVPRLADLSDRDIALFFGRIWMDDGEDFHIGRRHIRDEAGDPLVLDWRAPLAEQYYRASAHDRRDVAKRRRFGFQGARITGFEDENLLIG